MKTIEARFTLYAVGLFISTIAERIVTAIISSVTNLSAATHLIAFHFISTIILVFFFILSTVGIKWFIQRDFITRLIHKHNYIGGRWVEIVVDSNSVFHHYNILDINHGAYSISLVGTTFDKELNFDYKFVSLHATLEDGEMLSYTFVQRNFADSAILDMGVLKFFSHDAKSVPREYFGNYRQYIRVKEEDGITLTQQEVFSLRAFRLDEVNFKEFICNGSKGKKKKDVKNITKDELEEIMIKCKEKVCSEQKRINLDLSTKSIIKESEKV